MELWALVRLKLVLLKNHYLRGQRKRVLAQLVFLGFGMLFAVSIYRGLAAVMTILSPAMAQNMLVTALSGVMTFAVFWNMSTILNQFYLSSDLELLLALPLVRRSIFAIKLLEAGQGILVPSGLALATLWGYGAAVNAALPYYGASLLILLLTLAFSLLFSVLLIMWIMRFLPARRAQELWTVFWTMAYGLIWAGWMVFSNSSSGIGQAALMAASSSVRLGRVLSWTPSGWAAGAVIGWAHANWSAVLTYGLLLAGSVVGLYYIDQLTFEKVFYEGWSRTRTAPTRKRRTAPPKSVLALRGETRTALLSQQFKGLVLKDWLTLARDPSRLSRLVFPLLMGVVYAYLMARDTAALGPASYWLATLLSPIVAFFFSLYFSTGAVSAERENMALMRAAPVTGGQFLGAKLLSSWLPIALIAEVSGLATLALVTRSTQGLLQGGLLMLWISLELSVAGVALGALWPDFGATGKRRHVSVAAAYGYMALGLLCWGTAMLAFTWLRLTLSSSTASSQALFEVLPQIQSFVGRAWVGPVVLALNCGVCALLGLLWALAVRRMGTLQVTDLQS